MRLTKSTVAFTAGSTNDLQIDEQAEKGIILNSRILWTFSRAALRSDDPRYKEAAQRAYEYLTRHFVDEQAGGVYWTVGLLRQTKRQKEAGLCTGLCYLCLNSLLRC